MAIVLGALGLWAALRWHLRAFGVTPMTPIYQAYEQNGVMHAWSVFIKLWSLALSVVLLIGGIQFCRVGTAHHLRRAVDNAHPTPT